MDQDVNSAVQQCGGGFTRSFKRFNFLGPRKVFANKIFTGCPLDDAEPQGDRNPHDAVKSVRCNPFVLDVDQGHLSGPEIRFTEGDTDFAQSRN